VWSDSKYRTSNFGTSSGKGLNLKTAYTRVEGLQITQGNTGDFQSFRGVVFQSSNCRVSGCIIKVTSSGTGSKVRNGMESGCSGSNYFYNNLVLVGGDQGYGFWSEDFLTGSCTIYAENNTFIKVSGAPTAMQRDAETIVALNNLVSGFGDTLSYVGTFASGTDYNTTDGTDSIGTGSNNSTSQTFTFTNSAGGDYSLASGDTGARDKGSVLSSVTSGYTDDIVGTARDGSGQIDCGCFEFPAAVGGQPTSKRFGGVQFTPGNFSPSIRRW
jgi:hypothetical protein